MTPAFDAYCARVQGVSQHYGSAIALVFFVLIVVLAAVMLIMRQRMHWNETGGAA